jgi:hypothetical protein
MERGPYRVSGTGRIRPLADAKQATNEKAPPNGAGQTSWSFRLLPLRRRVRSLFQRVVDRGEFVVQGRTEAVDHSDNRKRNARCDQAVFDRCGAGFVGEKLFEDALQFYLPMGCAGAVNNWGR